MISLKPELKIFLSVDVINSTQYKNQYQKEEVQPWLKFFHDFFTGFPDRFIGDCDAVRKSDNTFSSIPDCTPSVWKINGDEIIFEATLTNHVQALLLISALKKAIEEFNEESSEYIKSRDDKVQIKGTAWLAGFPVGNAKIETLLYNVKSQDYIGPLIDIGFRLTKHSESEFMVVSVELAYMLAEKNCNLHFFFLGKSELKGVFDSYGREIRYPIIGVSVNASSEEKISAIHNIEKEFTGDKYKEIKNTNVLKTYCGKIINYVGEPLMIPFIEDDPDYNQKSPDYDKKLNEIIQLHESIREDVPPDNETSTIIKGPSGKNDIKEAIERFKSLGKEYKTLPIIFHRDDDTSEPVA